MAVPVATEAVLHAIKGWASQGSGCDCRATAGQVCAGRFPTLTYPAGPRRFRHLIDSLVGYSGPVLTC